MDIREVESFNYVLGKIVEVFGWGFEVSLRDGCRRLGEMGLLLNLD